MPLEGHWERMHAPVARGRERATLIAGALAAVALLVLVLAASIRDQHAPVSAGCKRVVVAMSTGGAAIERCR